VTYSYYGGTCSIRNVYSCNSKLIACVIMLVTVKLCSYVIPQNLVGTVQVAVLLSLFAVVNLGVGPLQTKGVIAISHRTLIHVCRVAFRIYACNCQ